ncbi:MAG: hypothetical protein ACREXX_16245 [Gammaproteobacteria bacterium]
MEREHGLCQSLGRRKARSTNAFFPVHSPIVAGCEEQAVRLETVTVVADRLPVGATDEPFSGTVISREEG